MRARSVDADRFEGARLGISRSVTGMGEPLEEVPSDLEHAVFETERQHGGKSARMLKRFAELGPGQFIWTSTGEDEFRLGRITGPWRYEDSEVFQGTGICNVRSVRWAPVVFDPLSVPDAVAYTFRRGGRNFQRIRDDEVAARSLNLWSESCD